MRACVHRAGGRHADTLCRAKYRPGPHPAQTTPDALRLEQALQLSAPLARLQQRMQESNERFEAIRIGLPPAMAAPCEARAGG